MKREYIILVTTHGGNKIYIKKIRDSFGLEYHCTSNIEKAKIWCYKRSVDKYVERLNNGDVVVNFSTQKKKSYTFKTMEITPLKTLRKLKLKKLKI